MKRLCWILVMIFFVYTTGSFSKEWNGIIPCVSKRPDVEKILGRAKYPMEVAIYHYKKSKVHIRYHRKDENDFNKDVVIEITVYPDKREKLAKYIKKIPNFHKDFVKKEVDDKTSHIKGLTYYQNITEGFEIEVRNYGNEEIISGFSYFAPEAFSNSSSQGNQGNQSQYAQCP